MNVPPPPPPAPPPPPPPPPGAAGGPSYGTAGGDGYPATLTIATPEKVANWRPLVHWLLAIPHFVIMYVLGLVAQICALISWFAIVFTGRLPEGLGGVSAMYIRYSNRVGSYVGFLHEQYPPFEFGTTSADPGGHAARTDLAIELEGRNRLTVGLRFLWIIPALIVTYLIFIIAAVCWFIAFFAVLFTGKWPDGLRNWVLKALRASTRLNAYMFLLTDRYPPLSFD